MILEVSIGVLVGAALATVAAKLRNRELRTALDETTQERDRAAGKATRADNVLKAMSDVVVVLDGEDRVVAVKLAQLPPQARTALVRFHGEPMGEILGEELASRLAPAIASCRDRGTVESLELDFAIARRSWRFDVVVYPSSAGEVVLVFRDVTEANALREAIGSGVGLAERVAEARADFLARVTHDMRNPLTGVIASAAMLRNTALASEQGLFVETIIEAGNHLVSLTNDLTEFSRLQAAPTELTLTDVHVDEVLGAVLDLQGLEAQEKGVRLVGIVEPTVPPVVTDATRLKQILLNIIGNAVKFTDEGEVVADVSWRGEALRIEVRDTGTGIEEQSLPSLFDPYVQAAGSDRKHMGTGLGLAITKQWVEAMGGEIEVESRVGEGTTFRMVLPLRPAAIDPPPAPLDGKRVLLYCRDDGERRGLSCDIEALGGRVDAVSTVAELRTRLDDPDGHALVIAEHHDDGSRDAPLEVARRGLRPPTPLVALSTVLDGSVPGVAASLLRPVRRSRMRATVEELLRERAAPRVSAGRSRSPESPRRDPA